VLVHAIGCDHLKGIQRVLGLAGVHARIQDAETALVKVAAYAGKQVGLVLGVDHHLQALTNR
jgi:hypothetical protein